MNVRKLKILCAVISTFFLLCVVGYAAGLRFNSTPSIPLGIYIVSSKEAAKGSYVMFCPMDSSIFFEARDRGYIESGFCKGNLGYMMKEIAAMSGDVITSNNTGVFVNGEMLKYSKPLAADSGGRPLIHFKTENYKLLDGELLLMTDCNPRSFDARYFGLLNRKQIEAVLNPLIVW